MIGFAEDITLGEVVIFPDIANEVIRNLSEQLMALHKPDLIAAKGASSKWPKKRCACPLTPHDTWNVGEVTSPTDHRQPQWWAPVP